jgi:hypothetical protein
MGINVVNTLMLCFHHNLLQHHHHGIHLNKFMNKCSVDRKEDTDNIHRYSMTKFAGILGYQLINLGIMFDERLKLKIPGSISNVDTMIQRTNLFSSVSMTASFSSTTSNPINTAGSMDETSNTCFNDIILAEKGVDGNDDIIEIAGDEVAGVKRKAVHLSDSSSGGTEYNCAVLVSYCDSLGNYHHEKQANFFRKSAIKK